MTILEQAYAIREAMDVAGATLTDEQALVCVRLYRLWEMDKAYPAGVFLTYGVNGVGDPQLYKVAQSHISQADWLPDLTPALYTPIGLDDNGYPVWAQPTGAHDAYNKGDVVNHNDTLYESLIDGNTTVPGTDARFWKVYAE
jgi:hypothetical protein